MISFISRTNSTIRLRCTWPNYISVSYSVSYINWDLFGEWTEGESLKAKEKINVKKNEITLLSHIRYGLFGLGHYTGEEIWEEYDCQVTPVS